MMKTIYVPCRAKLDAKKVAVDIESNIAKKNPQKTLGLLSTAQFVGNLDSIAKELGKKGIDTVISEGRGNPGQVLGCDARAAKGADVYVYIGSGRFHPLRVAMETAQETYIVHPEGGVEKISDAEINKYRMKQAARVHKVKEAKRVGLLVSTKPGQCRMGEALKIKKAWGGVKEVFIFAASEIRLENLLGYDVEAWVNTGCPRIVDDSFDRPIVDYQEL